jgi:hopanoid-associated phosphorylase
MILAVTGLERERRMLAAPDIEAVAGGGDHVRLEAALERLAIGMDGIISIGIAGALAPSLRPGHWVVADAVRDAHGESHDEIVTNRGWADRLASSLPQPERGLMLGTNFIVATAADKAGLHLASGAIAIDMESHVAARVAARHRLPFAVARVISDAAHRTLPPAARVGMRPDGSMNLPAVLQSLLAAPWQLPALIRTALEAEQGFNALLRGHRRLGPGLGGSGFGGPDLGKLPLDVV